MTQEADEEFTRPAKSCCMYIQQLRERPSLLKEVDAPMRRCVRHWKDAHPAASSVMATSATARSSANNRQPTPPPPPNSNSSNRERAEQGRAGDGTRTSFRRSPQYLLPVLRKITSENFENRLLFQGASLIEAMRRCPLSNGRLPSKRTTPQLTETAFFISRTSRFVPV